jgi:uncharacterized protein (TIGR02118 family)
MSFQMIGMYRTPEDVAAFDHHYETVHAPLAATLPGLRAFTMTHPAPIADGEPAEYHLVSTLTFDDEAAFAAALGGEIGQQAVADLPNFAAAGVTILTGPVTTAL